MLACLCVQLAAVESGDLSQIDVKSLLGEALQTLTDEVREEGREANK